MSTAQLFITCTLIWGSTWLAITYQLGNIDPVYSVAFRFTMAAAALGLYCRIKKLSFYLPGHIHFKMAMVGLCLYTLNYSFLYESQQYIVSALVALMSSCIIYINVAMRRVFLGKAIRKEVVLGATLGMIGMAMIFMPEFSKMQNDQLLALGIGLACVSFFVAAVGNVVSERILDHGTPVIQMNFWAMSYAVVFLFGYGLISGAHFALPTTDEYWLSLSYLSLVGSVLGFGAYMKLVQQIGSDKAAYVVLMYPLVALVLSTVFEGYRWHIEGLVGVLVVLVGNAIAMGKLNGAGFKAWRAKRVSQSKSN